MSTSIAAFTAIAGIGLSSAKITAGISRKLIINIVIFFIIGIIYLQKGFEKLLSISSCKCNHLQGYYLCVKSAA